MNKLFIFLTFFIITAISRLDPVSIDELKSQKFDASKRYCEKKIDEGDKTYF